MERDRVGHLTDLANAVRFAQNANKEEFSNYIDALLRLAG